MKHIPHHLLPVVKAELKRVLEKGVIRPWAANMHLDGSLRICGNYIPLNARMVKDAYPLPNIGMLLDSLQSFKCFATLDLEKGCWQLPLTKEAAIITLRWGTGITFERYVLS
eukprot:Protomagalhaensia_wolfi_Nauph_80__2979@NODE_3053_length_908_cov_33_349827_g2393_i0_p1_GENE_NODE_3053_length_908_cov_33_349827_g2393_i0NODE_3053_length_908_cov_33_349827_g2393_i0_p1_ORF_typecomplete_len112_score3_56_NODE_3053_length_908_cov_33_349827_g2393_i0308643